MDGWGVDYFERLLSPSGALQAVLLAAGIYLLLTFLKTSRGSGLVRGLVVGALKHALADKGGTLIVRFTVDGETSVLEVEDDGPGLSETDPVGVGRTLMTAFAKQLRGTTEVLAASPRGSRVRMTFVTPRA